MTWIELEPGLAFLEKHPPATADMFPSLPWIPFLKRLRARSKSGEVVIGAEGNEWKYVQTYPLSQVLHAGITTGVFQIEGVGWIADTVTRVQCKREPASAGATYESGTHYEYDGQVIGSDERWVTRSFD